MFKKFEELMEVLKVTPVMNSIDEAPEVAHSIIAKLKFDTAIDKLQTYHNLCWWLKAEYLLNEYADL